MLYVAVLIKGFSAVDLKLFTCVGFASLFQNEGACIRDTTVSNLTSTQVGRA